MDLVSVTMRQGETLGIVGESGSGKSTLAAMALLSLQRTSHGKVGVSRPLARRLSWPRKNRPAIKYASGVSGPV
ncbi:MAG: hypothetical protein CBARDCOR_4730 [uncultured Caballeronia sp.]|nr:MAG: hypothetical protein CBARDCOR_4730 [uncultured Caballeronia sp.]